MKGFAGDPPADDFEMVREQHAHVTPAESFARITTELEKERSAREDAERVSQMKDNFLAILSHELRTPLNAIFGWTQIIQRDPADVANVTKGIAVINRNVRAQTQLIEDLLDMSRIVAGQLRLSFQQTDLSSVVTAAIEAVKPAADAKHIVISRVEDAKAGIVSADASRLQQVFWNLLANAVKFTPVGGRIDVSLTRVRSLVEIRIADSGHGIPAEFLPHVFEQFRQADSSSVRKHGGLGLGLAIVKQLVELHHGEVWATSEGEGKGACFTVSLPLAAKRQQTAMSWPGFEGENSVEHAIAALRDVRALVVDDDADARELVSCLLKEYNANVRTAGGADEALELLSSFQPHVLISDVAMPGKDGCEFIQQVRGLSEAKTSRIPAIALTGFARSQDRNRALLAGFQLHVAKPIESQELAVMVASLLKRSQRNLS